MKFTNKAELPEAICNAIANDEYSKGDAKYSVSNLIQPIQAYQIIKRHAGEISVDYSDEIWKLLGSAVHYILEKGVVSEDSSYVVTEERMYMRVGGIVLSGKPDYMNTLVSRIEDYKVTSVWKILKGDYYDWECQLNIYRLLGDHNGRTFDNLQVNAILKDWKKYEKERDPKYPDIPVAKVSLPVWSLLDTTSFVLDKVRLLEASEDMTEDQLAETFPCSAKERWHKPDTFACIKPGGKRASATFDTHDEAFEYIQSHSDCIIEPRLGEDTRCLEFCLVNKWCRQFNKGTVIVPAGTFTDEDLDAFLNDKSTLVVIESKPISPADVEPKLGVFVTEFLMQSAPIRNEIIPTNDNAPIQPEDTKQGMEENIPVVQEGGVNLIDGRTEFEKSIEEQRAKAWAAIQADKPKPVEEPKLESIDKKVDLDIENLFKDLGI